MIILLVTKIFGYRISFEALNPSAIWRVTSWNCIEINEYYFIIWKITDKVWSQIEIVEKKASIVWDYVGTGGIGYIVWITPFVISLEERILSLRS